MARMAMAHFVGSRRRKCSGGGLVGIFSMTSL
jgi:hypothetical protein